MGKVTIQEIASKLIAQNGLSKKEAMLFINMMFDTIREALEREKMVKVKGLGIFKIIDVESRESVNVNTGERVLIEGHNKITFTPDALMKELVNKPFSQFETVVLNDGVDFNEAKEEEASEVEDGENDMTEVPLVDFIAPDPIDIGTTVAPEKPIAPVVSETPAISETPVVPETSTIPEVQETPEIQETPAVPTEPVTDNPVLPKEPGEELSDDDSSVEDEYEDEEDEENEETPTGGMRWVIVLLASLISLLVGYMLGNYFPWSQQSESTAVNAPQTENVIEAAPDKTADTKIVTEPTKQPEEKVEAPVEEAAPPAEKADKPDVAPVEQPKPEAKPEVQKPVEAPKQQPVAATPAEVKFDEYEAKDARVRTGAYRIVGLDYTEKVRVGDNLQRICKRTLGPGMECYIEVYNDLTATSPLKTGQEIKIPKLKWKVKRKAPQK